jgi:hypothetical protein
MLMSLESARLSGSFNKHHDALMRTSVTLDRDLEQTLREAAVRTRKPFKKVLNVTLRSALESKFRSETNERIVAPSKSMELRTGQNPAGFNRLVIDLEVEACLGSHRETHLRTPVILPDAKRLLSVDDLSCAFHSRAKTWCDEIMRGPAPSVVFGFVRISTYPRIYPFGRRSPLRRSRIRSIPHRALEQSMLRNSSSLPEVHS